MRYRELAAEVKRLPIDEQLLLLEEMTRALRIKLALPGKQPPQRTPLLWRGMLKTGGPAPTDEEVENAYTNYLLEKYQ